MEPNKHTVNKLTLLDLTRADPGTMAHVSPEQLGILLEVQRAIMLVIRFVAAVYGRLAAATEMIEWPGRPESRPTGRSNFIFAGHFRSLLGGCILNGS